MGFNKSKSGSSSSSQVWDVQSPFLSGLWEAGSSLLGQQNPAIGQQAQEWAGQINPQALGAFQSLLAGPSGDNPALAAYGNQLSNQFQNQIMPQLSRGAAGVGQLGGGRQGVAEGVAAGMVQDNMQNFAGQQYQMDRQNQLNALTQSGSMFNLGMAPYQAAWMPLQMQAGLLGNPAILNQSKSKSSGFGLSL